jgi:hypothetical protein
MSGPSAARCPPACPEKILQCFRLRRIRALVEVERHLPVAVEHPLGRADDHRGIQAAEIDLVRLPSGDMPADHHIAMILRCQAQEDAVATDIAGTRLEVITGDTK